MMPDSIPFNARVHVPIAIEMSENGHSLSQIAKRFGVSETRLSPSGLWHDYPEWKNAFPLIKQNQKAKIIERFQELSVDPTATSVNLSATKWLASVICGLSEKVEQSIEIEGNIHKAREPISFKSMMIPRD
jgi:hypothetical protein